MAMDIRTKLALDEINERCGRLQTAHDQLRAEVLHAADREQKLRERIEELEKVIGEVRVTRGLHREPIEVPPAPKILREIGVLPS